MDAIRLSIPPQWFGEKHFFPFIEKKLLNKSIYNPGDAFHFGSILQYLSKTLHVKHISTLPQNTQLSIFHGLERYIPMCTSAKALTTYLDG